MVVLGITLVFLPWMTSSVALLLGYMNNLKVSEGKTLCKFKFSYFFSSYSLIEFQRGKIMSLQNPCTLLAGM